MSRHPVHTLRSTGAKEPGSLHKVQEKRKSIHSSDCILNNLTLKSSLGGTHVDVRDVSKEGEKPDTKFSVIVVSPKFNGKTVSQMHDMVNSLLDKETQAIVEMKLKTKTPREWEEENSLNPQVADYSADYFVNCLKIALNTTYLDVFANVCEESKGCGTRFDCIIVSPKFLDKSSAERKELVHSVLERNVEVSSQEMKCFAMKTFTPREWAEMGLK